MDFDFATMLFAASLVTGGIWAMDALLWAPERQERKGKEPTIVEYCRSFFPVILIVFLLRSFLVEPFRIPSGSMMPTLLAGDFILVNKFSYGIRLPVINKKVVELGLPQRGDVMVFRFPQKPSVDYIKRVVGLPGDEILYRGKQLYINGELQKQSSAGTYMGSGAALSMSGANRNAEVLGVAEHDILVRPDVMPVEGRFIVPQEHFFVMGDNRDNSNDSRFWGSVPEENIVGKAFLIWMNWDKANRRITWNRIGDAIQ